MFLSQRSQASRGLENNADREGQTTRNLFNNNANRGAQNPDPSISGRDQGRPESSIQQQTDKPIKFKSIHKFLTGCLLQQNDKDIISLLQKPEIKEALLLNLEYFDKSEQKTQLYQRKHARVCNFGFGVNELGQECRNFKFQKIDFFWNVLVKHASNICQTSQLIISKYLSEYLIKNNVYATKLTKKQFYSGNYIRVPNNLFLQSLLSTNFQTRQRNVSLESQFFLQILEYIFNEHYSELIALVKIIMLIQQHEKRYFRDVIKKANCQYMTLLWVKLKKFSVLGIKKQIQENSQINRSIREFFLLTKKYGIEKKIWKQKNAVRIAIADALILCLNQYGSWHKNPTINSLIDSKQAVKFVDQDLQVLSKQRVQLPLKQYTYAAKSLQILLKVIPISSFSPKVEFRPKYIQTRQIEELRELIMQTKSFYLQSLRFLSWFTKAPQRHSQAARNIEQRWLRVPQNVRWIMRAPFWSEWLGLILACSSSQQIMESDQLKEQIVKVCKIVVQARIQEFWSQNPPYELLFIRDFLVGFVNQKGIKLFLPVLTKCLGDDEQKKRYTIKTLQIIGFQSIKREIRDNLIQTLQMPGKQNSSLKLSMFYSRGNGQNSFYQSPDPTTVLPRAFQSYPEQQLKFLCKAVANCKDDLGSIESILYQYPSQYSTGILICKFLMECLTKLRETKPSCIKCMRYIVKTVDVLFVEPFSRQAIMIAISLHFSQNTHSSSGPNQIYQLVRIACMKKSLSEQYRQSFKLKLVVAKHLCSITKFSMFMSEYFPLRQEAEEKLYTNLNSFIMNKNFGGLKDWYVQNCNNLHYRVTSYYTTLLLTLQSDQLVPLDFETIRLLIQKMKIDASWEQQYARMSSIVEILNKSPIFGTIASILQPSIQTTKRVETSEPIFLFSLVNQKFNQLMKLNRILQKSNESTSFKQDQSQLKSRQKNQARMKRQEQIAVGNIAGCLQLIGLCLKIINSMQKQIEGPLNSYKLLSKLQLLVAVKNNLTDRLNLYHYRIPLEKKEWQEKKSSSSFKLSTDYSESIISVNIIKVLMSFVNFEARYRIKYETHWNKANNQQEIKIDEKRVQMLQEEWQLQDFAIDNVLDMDYNQLTLKTDFTIGVGAAFRVLSQLLLTYSQNSGVIANCLSTDDCNNLYAINVSPSLKDSSSMARFVSQLLVLLEAKLTCQQYEHIFQFLILATTISYSILQQLLRQQNLLRMRRILNDLLKQMHQSQQKNNLAVINKMCLFVLAMLQNRNRYPDQIDLFIKHPTNIAYNLLDLLSQMFSSMQPFLKVPDSISKQQLFIYIIGYKRIACLLLYLSSINLCIEIFKRFFIYQSMDQNIYFNEILLKIAPVLLSIQVTPAADYINSYKVNAKIIQSINKTQQICLIESPVPNLKQWWGEIKFLQPFAPLLQSFNSQFGRNYAINGKHVFTRAIYSLLRAKDQAQKLLLRVYYDNYRASLADSHDELFSSLIGYLQIVTSLGGFGHLLTNQHEEQVLRRNFRSQNRTLINESYLKTIYQIIDRFKFQVSLGKGSEKSPFGYTGQEAVQFMIKIIKILCEYFQKSCEKQWKNDLIINTLGYLFQSLGQMLYSGDGSNGRKNQAKRFQSLLSFAVDSTQKNFKISPKVYLLFIDCVIRCCTMNWQMLICCSQLIENIVQILQQLIVYGDHCVLANSSISRCRILNQFSLSKNAFLISAILTKLISGPPIQSCVQITISSERISQISIGLRHVMQQSIYLIGIIVNKFLVDNGSTKNSWDSINFHNFCLIKMVNTVVIQSGGKGIWGNLLSFSNKQYQFNEDSQMEKNIRDIVFKFAKFIIMALQSAHNCSLFRSLLMLSLSTLIENAYLIDVSTTNLIMSYIQSNFDTNWVKNNKQMTKQHKFRDASDKEDDYNFNLNFNLNSSRTAYKRLEKKSNRQLNFEQLICYENFSQSNLSLTKMLQLSNLLHLLSVLCSQQQFWTSTSSKYSGILETVFNSLINQKLIYDVLGASKSTNSRLLSCRIAVGGYGEQSLASIQINQLDNLDNEYSYMARPQEKLAIKTTTPEGKRTNLFQFTVHVQITQIIIQFIDALTQCLQKSQNLQNLYSKLVGSGLSCLDHTVWQKVYKTLILILQYFNEITINYIRYYPKSLRKMLILYTYVRNNTDFGYETNFLTTIFSDAGISGFPEISYVQQYKDFIMDSIISFANCSVRFIEIWKANDWKQAISLHQARRNLTNQVFSLYRNSLQYVCSKNYLQQQESNIQKLQMWFNANKTTMQ